MKKFLLLLAALASLGNVPIAAGRFNHDTGQIATLGTRWYDATQTVSQACEGSTDGHCRIALSDGRVLAQPADAPTVAADGAGIVAWENSIDGAVHDSLGHAWPAAGLSTDSAGPDGAYALKVLRNSFGPWDVIERDGSRWRLTDGDAHDIQLLGNRRAIWMIGDAHFATPGLPIVFPNELTWGGRAAWTGDHFGLLYQRQSDGSLVFDGHVIAPPCACYFYFDVEVRNGVMRVTWSPSQADDRPQLLEIPLSTLASLPVSPSPSAPPAPTPVPTPPPAPAPVPQTPLPDPAHAKAIVVQERAKFSDASMHAADIVTLLKNVARRLNTENFPGGPFGVLVKSGGTSCAGYSCDIICTGQDATQRQWDVLGNADPVESPFAGNQSPGWEGPLSPIAVRPCEIQTGAVVTPSPTPSPVPTPVPPVEDPRIAVLTAQVTALTQQIRDLQQQVADLQAQTQQAETDRDTARAALAAEQAKPAPSCEAVLPAWAKSLGIRVGCRVK